MPFGKIFFDQNLSRIFLFILVILLFWLFSLYIKISLLPQEIEFGEGSIFQVAQRFAQTADFKDIYPPAQQLPLIITNYPPVYILLSGLGIKLFGPELFSLRLISLFSVLGILIVLFLMVKDETRDNFSSAFIAAIFLTFYANLWFYAARVDLLANFLALLSAFFFFKPGSKHNYWPVFLLVILAVFTKQSNLIFLFAFLLILLMNKKKKSALLYGSCSIMIIVALGYLLQRLTSGQFLNGVFCGNLEQGFKFAKFLLLFKFFRFHGLLFLIMLISLISYFHQRRYQEKLIIFSLVFLASICLIFKAGSSHNYFIGAFIWLILAGSNFLGKLFHYRSSRFLAGALILLVLFMEADNQQTFLAARQKEALIYRKILNYLVSENRPNIFEGYLSLGVKTKGIGILDSFDYLSREKDLAVLIQGCKRQDYCLVGVGNRISRYRQLMGCLDSSYVKFDQPYLGRTIYLSPEKIEKFRQYMQ